MSDTIHELKPCPFCDGLRGDEWPACSEPDDRWPPQINACLREILRYRKQQIDPEGYRKELADAAKKAAEKPIKGSAQGGRKE